MRPIPAATGGDRPPMRNDVVVRVYEFEAVCGVLCAKLYYVYAARLGIAAHRAVCCMMGAIKI